MTTEQKGAAAPITPAPDSPILKAFSRSLDALADAISDEQPRSAACVRQAVWFVNSARAQLIARPLASPDPASTVRAEWEALEQEKNDLVKARRYEDAVRIRDKQHALYPHGYAPPSSSPVLSEQEIEEIRERESKATPGPWKAEWDFCGCESPCSCKTERWIHAFTLPDERSHIVFDEASAEDKEFLLHARTDIPRLLSTLTVAEGRVKALTTEHQNIEHVAFQAHTELWPDRAWLDAAAEIVLLAEKVKELEKENRSLRLEAGRLSMKLQMEDVKAFGLELMDSLRARVSELEAALKERDRALGNCNMMARRMVMRMGMDYAEWKHIVRFCEQGGVSNSILRESPPDITESNT